MYDELDTSADSVFINGNIYTVNDNRNWVEAVSIKDGRIKRMGSTRSIEKDIGWRTEIFDLKGKMVMPGLHDAHAHLFFGALITKVNCQIKPDSEMDLIISMLKACEKNGKKTGDWIIGGAYNPTKFPNNSPTNEELNKHFPQTPVYMSDFSGHNALVNAKALEMLDINKSTKDPDGGHFDRNPETGELTGLLVEGARAKVMGKLPMPNMFKLYFAIQDAMAEMNLYGTTSIQEAVAIGPGVKLLNVMDMFGQVSLSIDAHWIAKAPDGMFGNDQKPQQWLDERQSYASENIYVNNVKYFLDGVPLPPTPTDAKLDPETGLPDKKHLLIVEGELTKLFQKMDAEGIKIKTHAVGQGAARVVMNAMDSMRAKNGDSGIYHDIGHGQSVMKYDSDRPAKNNTVIEFSPTFWVKGERDVDVEFMFRTAVESGALVTAGTDWPVVASANLFPAIAGMVDNGDESIDLKTAIEVFTINGARSVGRDKDEGNISEGKWATFIVLDRNIFEVHRDQIAETKVERTVFKGEVVYSSGS